MRNANTSAIGRLVVDDCPDAAGFWTVRPADGTVHGDTEAEPIATFYDKSLATAMVDAHNARETQNAESAAEQTALEIARAVVESADNTGCSEELTVCDAGAIARANMFIQGTRNALLRQPQYVGLSNALSLLFGPLGRVIQAADDTGCSPGLTVTSAIAIEETRVAIGVVSKMSYGKLTGMDDWEGAKMVLGVHDMSPYGDDKTPVYGLVSVNSALINRVMALREVLRREKVVAIQDWQYIDWHNEPRVEMERLWVCDDRVWFSAHHKHGDFGFETRTMDFDEFVIRAVGAKDGALIFQNDDVRQEYMDACGEDPGDEDEVVPGM